MTNSETVPSESVPSESVPSESMPSATIPDETVPFQALPSGGDPSTHDHHGDTDRDPERFLPVVAGVGAVIAGLGVSGLLDDSGLIDHPWWTVLVLAIVLGAVFGIVSTLRQVATSVAVTRGDTDSDEFATS